MNALTRSLQRYLLLGALAWLSACATRPPSQQLPYEAHLASLAAIDHWRVKGKIGLRQNARGTSATLHWEQRGGAYSVYLHGPLGMGSVYVDGDDHGVRLRDQHGEHQAANAETLITSMTGWQIPITPLRYWAKGMPAPDLSIAAKTLDGGRLTMLQQGGWSIEYSHYVQVDEVWLPGKIVMSRPQTRLILIHKHWRIL